MKNEEALKWLTDLRASLAVPCGSALSEERKSFAEAVDVAIDALERDRWISVEERLPEQNTSVLVYAIGNTDGFWGKHVTAIADIFLFKFFPSSKGEEEWSSPWQYFHTDYKITHWMPLPEPPKEEET